MTEIPTLAEFLARHYQTTDGCNCGADVHEIGPWATHVAEAYQEARTIRNLDQADGLPMGSVIREHPDDPLVAWVAVRGRSRREGWRAPLGHFVVLDPEDLPALVLWTPRDGEPA